MSNLRANIRNHITVNGSDISFNTIYPLQLVLRGRDGYLWVELYDTTYEQHDQSKLIDTSGVFGDTYAGKDCDAAAIREKAAILVEKCKYYRGA